jgi:hypothetical protein
VVAAKLANNETEPRKVLIMAKNYISEYSDPLINAAYRDGKDWNKGKKKVAL